MQVLRTNNEDPNYFPPPQMGEGEGGGEPDRSKGFPLPFIPSRQGRGGFWRLFSINFIRTFNEI